MLGIIAAMPQEIAHMEQEIVVKSKKTVGKREFHIGTLGGEDVVLVLSRIGKVAAASTATTLINEFGVRAIVLTGVAGAISEIVNIGDVVIGDSFIQHDMDAEDSKMFKKYEIPFLGITTIPADGSLANRAYDAATNLKKKGGIKGKVHRGQIISGDQFIASVEKVKKLRCDLPEALCVEMEGAAIAQVCYEFGVPFTAIRSISDRADASAHLDFGKFIDEIAAPLSHNLVVSMFQ